MNLGIGISLTNYRSVPTVALDPDAAIAALFESGEVGAWYDPSDSSTVWQDAAGTTPASVGDPVGRIDDKSGNGNHATQTTSAARPVLQSSGGLYYLDFDGVDDYLTTGTFAAGAQTQPITLAEAGLLSGDSSAFHVDSEIGGTGRIILYTRVSVNRFSLNAGGAVSYNNAKDGANHVWLALFNESTFYVNKDGSQLTPDSGTLVGFNSWSGLTIGASNVPSGWSADHVYGFVGINRTLTAGEISDLESYLATKSGVTL